MGTCVATAIQAFVPEIAKTISLICLVAGVMMDLLLMVLNSKQEEELCYPFVDHMYSNALTVEQNTELEAGREKEARLQAESERAKALEAKEFAESKLNGKRQEIRRLERKLAILETELTAADHERELMLDEIYRLNRDMQTPTQVLEYGSSSQESD